MIDKAAEDFTNTLAELLTPKDPAKGKVHRFTPSIKEGRRYLVVETEDIIFHITVEASENLARR